MGFPGVKFPVDFVKWIEDVLKLGQGKTTDPGLNEIRMFLSAGEYILKGHNGTFWVATNRPLIYVDNQTGNRGVPLLQGGHATFGANVLGTVTFNTAFSSTPTVVATPENKTAADIYVKSITTTGCGVASPVAGYNQWFAIGQA